MDIKISIADKVCEANGELLYKLAAAIEKGEEISSEENCAEGLYKLAAAAGYNKAFTALGKMYFEKDFVRASIYFKKASEGTNGDHEAMLLLADLFESNNDYESAVFCLKEAFSKGSSAAAYRLGTIGMLYLRAEEEAMLWYKKAADMGHYGAMIEMAKHYEKQENFDLAVFWYRQAEDEDNAERLSAFTYDADVDIEYAED